MTQRRTPFFVFLAVVLPFSFSVWAGPDPFRFAGDIDAFEKDRIEAARPEGAILCVGSSSMRMWGDRMEADLSPLTVIPRGFGGSHFTDVNYYFDELVQAYKPRAILVYEGDNDLNAGKTPDQVFSDFLVFRKKVRDFDADIRVYVIGVKPSVTRWHLEKEIRQTNQLISGFCESDSSCTYIEMSTFLLDETGSPRSDIFLDDGIHLNRIGYHLWAATVALVLVPAESQYESK